MHSTVREGIVTGLLGAAAVALWFLIVDIIAGRPLHTPALLGAIVSRIPSPASAADGPDRLMLAALYTPIHIILFVLFGIAVLFLMHRAQKMPSLLTLAVMLFAILAVGFTGLVAMLESTVLGNLAWNQVGIGNLIAVLAMAWYVAKRHPGIRNVWARRLDDTG